MTEVSCLLRECERAIVAMKSAWYELEPGRSCVGTQFIPRDDMDDRIKSLELAVENVKNLSLDEVWIALELFDESPPNKILGVYDSCSLAHQETDETPIYDLPHLYRLIKGPFPIKKR